VRRRVEPATGTERRRAGGGGPPSSSAGRRARAPGSAAARSGRCRAGRRRRSGVRRRTGQARRTCPEAAASPPGPAHRPARRSSNGSRPCPARARRAGRSSPAERRWDRAARSAWRTGCRRRAGRERERRRVRRRHGQRAQRDCDRERRSRRGEPHRAPVSPRRRVACDRLQPGKAAALHPAHNELSGPGKEMPPPAPCTFFDELLDEQGRPRPHAPELIAGAAKRSGPEATRGGGPTAGADLPPAGTRSRHRRRRRRRAASDHSRSNLVPRILLGEEWRTIKAGLAQRIRALNSFVDDVYHGREIVPRRRGAVVADRLARVVRARGARHQTPWRRLLPRLRCDLVRDADGSWKVLEDNVRTPSGISYVLENRVAMTRLVPQLFAHYRVRPVDHYPALLLSRAARGSPTSPTAIQPSSYGRPDGSTRPTSSTPSRPPNGRRAVEHRISSSRDDVASCARRRASTACTRSTGASTTTSSTHWSSGRLAARRPRPGARVPRRHRRDRQRDWHGRRRRQGGLPLRPGDDSLTTSAKSRSSRTSPPTCSRIPSNAAPCSPASIRWSSSRRRSLVAWASSSGARVDRQLAEQAALIEREPSRWIAQELVRLSTVPSVTSDGHAIAAPTSICGRSASSATTSTSSPGADARRARRGVDDRQLVAGGGSKDTWVLEDGDGGGGEGERERSQPALPTCPTCDRRAGAARSSSSSSARRGVDSRARAGLDQRRRGRI